jgi:hypothetical protein
MGAGLFFPGFGWFGLILMLDLYSEAAQSVKLRRGVIVIILLAVPFLTLPDAPERVTVDGVTILGVNTSFGPQNRRQGPRGTMCIQVKFKFDLLWISI